MLIICIVIRHCHPKNPIHQPSHRIRCKHKHVLPKHWSTEDNRDINEAEKGKWITIENETSLLRGSLLRLINLHILFQIWRNFRIRFFRMKLLLFIRKQWLPNKNTIYPKIKQNLNAQCRDLNLQSNKENVMAFAPHIHLQQIRGHHLDYQIKHRRNIGLGHMAVYYLGLYLLRKNKLEKWIHESLNDSKFPGKNNK